ncbi:MAG: IS3 family transposase [Prosthecobacter sp.]|nr:IS3 family transposase [Prosthecobacter sp.]
MARKKHTAEEVVNKLRQADVELGKGGTVAAVCRLLGVTEVTYFRWRKQYGGMKVDQAKRLKELEQENSRLKRLLADAELDKAILREAAKGKLLSPARRRAAVEDAQRNVPGVSERRACLVLGQARAVQRYRPQVRDDETPLTGRIVELAAVYGSYGTPMITGMLRNDGWSVNHKRVERIWRQEGLKVPKKQPKRGRLWLNDGSCIRLRPERRNHVWAYDFVSAQTQDGRPLRMLVVVDEWTRECLSIDVARSLNSDDVLERLSWLMATRGVPEHVRSDNGPEFTAKAVREWLGKVGARTLFIQPGSPWENGYVESLNGKLRNELLNGEIFCSVLEAKVLVERWRVHYNTVRPHSALGYRPPAPETIAAGPHCASLRAVQRNACASAKAS